jgi:hypothetical protein
MAKDAKGHGSEKHGLNSARGMAAAKRGLKAQIASGMMLPAKPQKINAQGMRKVTTHTNGPHSASVYKNPEWGENVVKFFHNGVYQSKADYHTDDMADAHATAQAGLRRYSDQDAAKTLAKGSQKSAVVPTHSATPQTDILMGRLSKALKEG